MRATSGQVRRVWLLVVVLVVTTFLLALPATALAWGEVWVSGASWGGVDVYSNSPAPNPYYAKGDSGYGWRWQCVELAQRFYSQKCGLTVKNGRSISRTRCTTWRRASVWLARQTDPFLG